MPHVDATLREIEYAFDTLKLDGVGVYTNYGDKWLGDPMFNPVFEELNRRKAIVFSHPISLGPSQFAQLLTGDGAIQEQTDTTRAIANMIFGGAAERYPNVRMIFAHGGGTMPYLIERFTSMAKGQKFAELLPQGFSGAAGKFYYDTAWTSNAVAMGALIKVVPLSQIMLGSDYPARTIADHVKGLKECGIFTDQQLDQVERQNALALFRNSRPRRFITRFPNPAQVCGASPVGFGKSRSAHGDPLEPSSLVQSRTAHACFSSHKRKRGRIFIRPLFAGRSCLLRLEVQLQAKLDVTRSARPQHRIGRIRRARGVAEPAI